jgi:hypothetical protein
LKNLKDWRRRKDKGSKLKNFKENKQNLKRIKGKWIKLQS